MSDKREEDLKNLIVAAFGTSGEIANNGTYLHKQENENFVAGLFWDLGMALYILQGEQYAAKLGLLWIPVSEKLPDEEQHIFFTDFTDVWEGEESIHIGWYEEDQFWDTTISPVDDITYWAPLLPAPPMPEIKD